MTARAHHYLPQCYLKRFAKHQRKPKVYVLDLKDQRAFSPNPKNVAVERDFNRLDGVGVDPDALENAYSQFEGEVDAALGRVVAARSISNEDDKIYILNFITLLAIRNPRLREQMRDFTERTSNMMMEVILATPERWESHVRRMHEVDGKGEKLAVTYEQMKDFVARGEYSIQLPTLRHIQMELESFETVLPFIVERKWRLLRTNPSNNTFVTCDHPVCTVWSNPRDNGRMPGPGYGMTHTEVLFPLSKELALIGSFEGSDREDDVGGEYVAAYNSTVATFAERQVYAQDGEFLYYSGRRLRRGAEMKNDTEFVRPRRR